MKLFSFFDFFIIIFVFFAIFFSFFIQNIIQKKDKFVIFTQNQKIEFPLSKDTTIFINSVEIELKNQTAKITKSDCKNQICVASPKIYSNGQIVCVPNKVMVLLNKKNTEIDVYAH
ncbi:MAG: NusG domain II-containing protein [Chitinivibrionia bacterium]|nr:NusG domain II-containing protein [Chitinivibrionia bacterium]